MALARMVEIDRSHSPLPWARPLHWGFANLLTDVHLGTGHVGPCDLTVMDARVEIRALWARIHELDLELHVLRVHLATLLVQAQVHG